MRILMMAQHYAPEEVSGAVLATELAEDLVAKGHEVTFVTCAPNYPLGEVFPGYHNRLLSREMRQGVTVIRTWSYISPPVGFWRRLFNYGSFSASAFFGGLAAGKHDLIFSYSPPLPLGVSAWLLSRLWRRPWVLRVEDLYPDAAIAAGVLQNRLAIRFFHALEKWLYRAATHISLISNGFRRALRAKGITDEKLSVVPVWADPDSVPVLPKENAFRRRHGLEGKFVVMYAGTLGHASAVEDIVACARVLRNRQNIHFLFVGEGVKKARLEEIVLDLNLGNVSFLPFQPRAQFAEMMAAADVNLVTLNQQSAGTSLPSKTFNIMASGRAILAVTPPDSEIAQLVQQTGCGVNVPPDSIAELAKTITTLKAEPEALERMGELGRQTLVEKFSRPVCTTAYETTLTAVESQWK